MPAMEKDLFADLLPDEEFEPTPEFIGDILLHAWEQLRRYRLCREHPERTDGEFAIAAIQLEMAVGRVHEARMELKRMTAPSHRVTAELDAAKTACQAAEAKAAKATKSNADLKRELELTTQRADHFEALCQQLQDRNLERPDVASIVRRILIVMTGMRVVQWVSDPGDLNRQTVNGILLQLQRLLHECGAEVDTTIRPETCQAILNDYYATLRPRDVESLKVHGHFYDQIPERMTA